MIRRITLENYMSHANTVIEPAAGLTVLSGPNNCGKSAVVSALMNVRGDGSLAGDFMLRHEEKLCTVTIETDDDHTIVWKRRKKTVVYVIDGVEVIRAGPGKLPDALPGALRLPVIEPANSGKKFDLHFGLQKDPIFLINSESDPARFFSTANDAERLLEMQQLQKQRVRDANNRKNTAAAELAAIEGKLNALAPLDGIEAEVVTVEKEYEALVHVARRMALLRKLLDDIAREDRERRQLEEVVAGLGALQPPPAQHDTGPLQSDIKGIDRATAMQDRASGFVSSLAPLAMPPPIAPTEPLAALVKGLTDEQRRQQRWAARVDALKKLSDPPSPTDPSPLTTLTQQLRQALTARDAAQKNIDALAALQAPPAPVDLEPIKQLISQWTKATAALNQRRASLENIKAEVTAFEARIDSWMAEHPTCPVCGGKTSRTLVLDAGGHTHD